MLHQGHHHAPGEDLAQVRDICSDACDRLCKSGDAAVETFGANNLRVSQGEHKLIELIKLLFFQLKNGFKKAKQTLFISCLRVCRLVFSRLAQDSNFLEIRLYSLLLAFFLALGFFLSVGGVAPGLVKITHFSAELFGL